MNFDEQEIPLRNYDVPPSVSAGLIKEERTGQILHMKRLSETHSWKAITDFICEDEEAV